VAQTRPPGLPGGRGATPAQQALCRRGAFQPVAVSEAPLRLAALGASPASGGRGEDVRRPRERGDGKEAVRCGGWIHLN